MDGMRWFVAILVALSCLPAPLPAAAATLAPVDNLPLAVLEQLPAPASDAPGRDKRRFYRLDRAAVENAANLLLVLERDRGQRVAVYNADGRLIQDLPVATAPAPALAGLRGAGLPLSPEAASAGTLYIVVDSVLGVHPRLRVETPLQFHQRERAVWVYEVTLASALLMLMVLSLAFSLILREPGYLAYVGFLLMMLLAIALRHPLAFRSADLLHLSPERIAALGVLVSTIAALAAVTLLRAASGIGTRYPRGSRAMQWIALGGIAFGVIDVLAIRAWFPLAQLSFNLVNLSFGANAALSAWLLAGAAWSGGRTARLFLLGWVPMVLVGAWFSIGSLIGLPQTQDPHRWVLFACVLQGLGWAVALGDRALSLQRERDRAWALAELDELTGLPNRRMLDREIGELRVGWLMVCDLDFFKVVNDRHGHAVGDRCLVHFAQCLRESLAGAAVFGRYGGEEFVAIVPGGSSEEVRELAERLRERTASTPVHVDGDQHRLTVSIGLAALEGDDPRAALKRADQAMYRAKAGGRNRVELAA